MKERRRKRLSIAARIGYTARGLVFLTIATLAARGALLQGSEPEGTRGALEMFLPVPFGRIMLGALATGLAGYVLWRYVQAATVPFSESSGWRSLPRRLAFAISGTFYGLLMLTAAQLALGLPTRSSNAKEEWSAWLLQVPLGQTLLALVGMALVGGGLHTVYRGVARRFTRLYDRERMHAKLMGVAKVVGVTGLVTMGLTLAAIGGYAVQAAIRSSASRIQDLHGILLTASIGTYGRLVLGVLATGLAAYALHCFVLAAFRKIGT